MDDQQKSPTTGFRAPGQGQRQGQQAQLAGQTQRQGQPAPSHTEVFPEQNPELEGVSGVTGISLGTERRSSHRAIVTVVLALIFLAAGIGGTLLVLNFIDQHNSQSTAQQTTQAEEQFKQTTAGQTYADSISSITAQ